MIIINPYMFSNNCVSIQNLTGSTVGGGTSTSTFLPAYGLYNYSLGVMLYKPLELGSAKQITGLQILYNSWTVPYNFLNQKITLAHSVQSSFTSTTPNTDLSNLTLSDITICESSFTQGITTNGVWLTVIFETPFCYNGVDNVALIWENNDGSWQAGYGTCQASSVTNSSFYAYWDVTKPVTGSRTSTRPNIRLIY